MARMKTGFDTYHFTFVKQMDDLTEPLRKVAIPIVSMTLATVNSALANDAPPRTLQELAITQVCTIMFDLKGYATVEDVMERVNMPKETVRRILGEFVKNGVYDEEIDPDDRRKRRLRGSKRSFERRVGLDDAGMKIFLKGYGPESVEICSKLWEEHGSKEEW